MTKFEQQDFEQATADISLLVEEINSVVIGQDKIVRQVIICLLANGHVLVEGVPGLGKTLLVRALSACFGGSNSRIQFTPDLMPSDVTGHAMFNMKSERFEVRRGPVFTNLLLADEINRAPAKTQAALLEVMQERRVTIEGKSFEVEQPFMVLATQNPIEQDGTYPLPEAELDRFTMKILIDYQSAADEISMVEAVTQASANDGFNFDSQKAVITSERVLALQAIAASVAIDDEVLAYLVNISRQTREWVGIDHGAGPRASIALARTARATALIAGRSFVTPDDIKDVAKAVLRHRIQLSPDLEIEGVPTDQVLEELLASIEAPRS